jgi:hypothetical protein
MTRKQAGRAETFGAAVAHGQGLRDRAQPTIALG